MKPCEGSWNKQHGAAGDQHRLQEAGNDRSAARCADAGEEERCSEGRQAAEDPWKECMDIAVELALRARQVVRKAMIEEKKVTTKTSVVDLVTETDHFVEDLIISALKEKFPSHRFPPVAVSIGFAVNKELEFGVIYHCTDEKLYTARKGQGAFCNQERLHVTKETGIKKSLILTDIGPKRDPATLKLFLGNMERLLKFHAHGIRVIGSSTLALCHMASGVADAYYQFGLHCWDLAAATVIIREAGGFVIDPSGGPLDLMSCRVVAAGTMELAQAIAKELQLIDYGRDDD
ncbi:inositol monophosphatase 2 isoform X2 [Rhinoderma darwinii]|uniref:inositol monophosphatase 2 isoform X2 n=1 Tax=Rhinoderma darwinii TaxID=43563 RepID=UPI003F6735B1